MQSSLPTQVLCAALGIPRATFYRKKSLSPTEVTLRQPPLRALSLEEKEHILTLLHSPRFQNLSVREVHATLLQEGILLASPRTFYRLLQQFGESKERRRQRPHHPYVSPVLCARGPCQVWTWDITKLRGPEKRLFYHLYVILDIFSRMVVGWLLAEKESAVLAEHLFSQTLQRENISPFQLSVHADRGAAMTSKQLSDFF